MSRYLNLARTAMHMNEENEKSRDVGLHERATSYEINEENEKSPRSFSREEAVSLGLNPDLVWVRVTPVEVEASRQPAEWDGSLPAACRWSALCQTLGPCPRHRAGGPCRVDGGSS